MRQKRRSQRDYEDDELSLSENLAAVNERLDDLTRQLERVAQSNDGWPGRAPNHSSSHASSQPRGAERVAEAIDRLDRRLDQIIAESRAVVLDAERNAPQAVAPIPQAPQMPPAHQMPQAPQMPPASPMPPMPAPVLMPPAPTPVPMAQPSQPRPATPSRPAARLPNWALEISARQRALDGDAAPVPRPDPAPAQTQAYAPVPEVQPPQAHVPQVQAPQAQAPQAAAPQTYAPIPGFAAAPAPEPIQAFAATRAPIQPPDVIPEPAPAPVQPQGPDLSSLEHHLRNITAQIATLHQPYEHALTALRSDLAEIGSVLADAMPRRAVEALEAEVRTLAERLDRSRDSVPAAGVDPTVLYGLENGLAEVRDALRNLTPAENLVGADETVRSLSRKIDQIATTSHDPEIFQQIEHAISSLRAAVSNVASDGALAQLAAEVHHLASNFERSAASNTNDALAQIDARIADLVESRRAVPPEFEASMRALSDQFERAQLSQGDRLALGSLEDRIVKLFEKLDASEARLGSIGSIERGVADLLVAVEELRSGGLREARAGFAEPRPFHDPSPVAPAAEPYIEQQAEPQYAPAAVDFAPMPPQPAPAPVTPAPIATPPLQPESEPLPPRGTQQHPRPPEPRRPIDPNLPPDTPLEPGMGAPRMKPGSPAARIAASEAALGGAKPVMTETGGKAAAIAAARNAVRAAADAPAAAAKPRFKAFEQTEEETRAATLLRKIDFRNTDLRKHAKTIVLAASVAAIVLGAVYTAVGFLLPDNPPDSLSAPSSTPAERPAGSSSLSPPAAPEPDATGQLGSRSQFFDPMMMLNGTPLPQTDITGSVAKPDQQRHAMAAAPIVNLATADLPATFGPTLRTAAASGDPAATYEIGLRYADGRGVTQNLGEAARWLEQAAKSGFAPAQFRLASMYEKGEGAQKDLQTARRYYMMAADKGHAKAMHNLAVLHAEGIDGKPDYKVAAQWFQRAANYGISDSQYNLAILYARGIGVDRNLAESYKWFALAAAKGDQDAVSKRDDVAGRLDQSTLMAATLAVQTFTPEREPDAAINLKTPPGGWDRAAAAQAVRSKPKAPAPSRP